MDVTYIGVILTRKSIGSIMDGPFAVMIPSTVYACVTACLALILQQLILFTEISKLFRCDGFPCKNEMTSTPSARHQKLVQNTVNPSWPSEYTTTLRPFLIMLLTTIHVAKLQLSTFPSHTAQCTQK